MLPVRAATVNAMSLVDRLHAEWEARSATRRWADELGALSDGTPVPADIQTLIDSRVDPKTWAAYATVHGFGLIPQTPDPSRPTAELILLHHAGVSPSLLDRWMTQQMTDDLVMRRDWLWTRMYDNIELMVDHEIPVRVAGLYALAGYDPGEAVTDFRSGITTTETLQVEVGLGLPELLSLA